MSAAMDFPFVSGKKIDKVVDKYLYTAEVIDVQHNNLVFFNGK